MPFTRFPENSLRFFFAFIYFNLKKTEVKFLSTEPIEAFYQLNENLASFLYSRKRCKPRTSINFVLFIKYNFARLNC